MRLLLTLLMVVFMLAGCDTPPQSEIARPILPSGRELNDDEIRMLTRGRASSPDLVIMTAASVIFTDKHNKDNLEEPENEGESSKLLDLQSPLLFEIETLIRDSTLYHRRYASKLHLKRPSREHDENVRKLREVLRAVGVENWDNDGHVIPFKQDELFVQAFIERVKEVSK